MKDRKLSKQENENYKDEEYLHKIETTLYCIREIITLAMKMNWEGE